MVIIYDNNKFQINSVVISDSIVIIFSILSLGHWNLAKKCTFFVVKSTAPPKMVLTEYLPQNILLYTYT